MVCECRIAGLFDIEFDGIISAQITGSSEFVDLISQCDTAPNVLSTVRKRLKGPSTGQISISAYAFLQGATDRFLGTSCPASAGINFNTDNRFDCENNVTRIIRTATGDASFREGDEIDGITIFDEFCNFRTVNASASSGPGSRVTDTDKFLGSNLLWTGPPFSFDSRIPDTLDFTLLGIEAKMTSFNISITVPSVATNSYSFVYSISSCEGDL